MRCLLWSLAMFAISPAIADFAVGLNAYKKGDYVAAVKEWRPLADSGDPAAQFNLGLLYLDGQGVPQDFAQAATWFTRSAEQDYTKAQLNLGALYGVGKGVKRDYVIAYKWLNVCAGKGEQKCIAQRDLVAKKLKGQQLAQAQKLASDFSPKKETPAEHK